MNPYFSFFHYFTHAQAHTHTPGFAANQAHKIPNFFQTFSKPISRISKPTRAGKINYESLLHDCILHYEYNQGVVKSSLVPLPSTNTPRYIAMASPSAARAPENSKGIHMTRVPLRKFKSASRRGSKETFT